MQIEAFQILHYFYKIVVIGWTIALSKDVCVNADSFLIFPNILMSVLIHIRTFFHGRGKQEEQKQKLYTEERGKL